MYRPVSCRIGYFRSPGGCCVLAECSRAVTACGGLSLRSLTLATLCYWSIPLACPSGLGQRDSSMPLPLYGDRPSAFGRWPPTSDPDPACPFGQTCVCALVTTQSLGRLDESAMPTMSFL